MPRYGQVEVKLSGEAENVFNTISIVRRSLMQAGVPFDLATEYTDTAMRCGSYEELLRFTRETVEVT
jgi:hypothetical protein